MVILPHSTPQELDVLKVESPRTTSCQPLDVDTVPYCANVGYDMVSLPNSRGHTTQQEVFAELQDFLPLILTGCSGAMVHFLCSVYMPPCFDDGNEVAKPCKELCEEVHDDCAAELVDKDEENWPQLQCSQFPSLDEDSNCYGQDPKALTLPAIPGVSYSDGLHGSACQPIEVVPLCRNLDYDNFSLPNQRGHNTVGEMQQELDDFLYFVRSKCSNSIVHFLCYYYAPACTSEQPQVSVQPCRELCEYTRDNCLAALNGVGIAWPPPMECSNFFYKNETNMCSGPSDPATLVIPDTTLAEPQGAAADDAVLEPSSASGLASRTNALFILGLCLAIIFLSL